MSSRGPFRSTIGLTLLGLVALVATGLPLSYDVDHGSDIAHMEHDHGGHGTVLIEQNAQLQSKSAGHALAPTPAETPWAEASASNEPIVQARFNLHRGRDPPSEIRPRAPPICVI